jgi:hypothetical protein
MVVTYCTNFGASQFPLDDAAKFVIQLKPEAATASLSAGASCGQFIRLHHNSIIRCNLWSGVRFQPEKNPRVRKQIIQRSSSHELPFDWQDESNLPARISDLVDRGLGSFSNLRCCNLEERMETCHTISQSST